jgi:flavodoxin
MNTVVVYGTRTGNTRRVAEAMTEALRERGTVTLQAVEDAPGLLPAGTDLLLVGGPTEGHGATPAVVAYVERLDRATVRGVTAAAFDTRLWWPRVLAGSAASRIGKLLGEKGARLVGGEGSFIVSMKPELLAGETARAASWAREIADAVETGSASPAGGVRS